MSIQPAGGAGDATLDPVLDGIFCEGAGITKRIMSIPLSLMIDWVRKGFFVIAEFNRKQVKARPGDANQLLDSIARGLSINLLIGFINGIVEGKELNPSKEFPINITEGGHRFRWLKEIIDGKATLGGHSLSRIQTLHPDLHARIMSYKIRIEVSSHASGEVPESFVREEYKRTNTLGCELTAGEIGRAETNENVKILSESLSECFIHRETKMNASARDKDSEFKAAIIQILVGVKDTTNDLKPTKEALVTLTPPDDSMDHSIKCIELMGGVEKTCYEKFGTTKKSKTKKYVHEAPKIELFGPLFYGLAQADDKAAAIATITSFFDKSLESEESWKANTERVKKLGLVATKSKTNGGNRNGRKRYEEGWNIVLSIVEGCGAVGGGSAAVIYDD